MLDLPYRRWCLVYSVLNMGTGPKLRHILAADYSLSPNCCKEFILFWWKRALLLGSGCISLIILWGWTCFTCSLYFSTQSLIDFQCIRWLHQNCRVTGTKYSVWIMNLYHFLFISTRETIWLHYSCNQVKSKYITHWYMVGVSCFLVWIKCLIIILNIYSFNGL